jgi:hypothetical protein
VEADAEITKKRFIPHSISSKYKQYAYAHASVASQAIPIIPVTCTIYFYYPE